MMEFTTPPSYGTQTVNVGMVFRNSVLLQGTTSATVEHTTTKMDPVTLWEEPTAFKVVWKGKTQDGEDAETVLETDLKPKLDCVDIMAEVPAIIKKFVAGAVGTRPYMYQVILTHSFYPVRCDVC